MGKLNSSKDYYTKGWVIQGLLKLDHLQPVKLIVFQSVPTFYPDSNNKPFLYRSIH